MFRRRRELSRQLALISPAIDFRTLLEGSLDMIWVAKINGPRHRYYYSSPSTADILGWTAEEMRRFTPRDLYTEESQNVIAAKVEEIQKGQESATITVQAICKDRHHIWLENKIRLLHRAEDGEITIAIYLREITERKRLEKQLSTLAFVDGLTSVNNRRAFDTALAREWKRNRRTGSLLSLILIDVDNFKSYNDTHGHIAGDECLRAVAQAIRSAARRPSDTVARYGGEEFAVLLPDTGVIGAQEVATRVCRSVTDLNIEHDANDGYGVVTVSAGIGAASGLLVESIPMPEGLVIAADSALYQAKQEGKNRFVTLPMGTSANQ